MVSAEDVRRAASRLKGVIVRTPLLSSNDLNHAIGLRVACKAETLQRTNAFKIRGAYHHIDQLSVAERASGVVGASSGNHALALAYAARTLGVRASVVVPADAPPVKLAAARRHGATIVPYDRHSDDREAIVAALAAERDLAVVPSANSRHVIAGAGTVALEILEEDSTIDTLLVPVGGGGLAAGCATIAKALTPRLRVVGVEPAVGDDTARSLREGRRISIPAPNTIADGLRHRTPSPLPFAIMQRLLDDIVTVDDATIAAAMALCCGHLKLVVEPSGACALAALLADHVEPRPRRAAVILSGGNVAWSAFKTMIGRSA